MEIMTFHKHDETTVSDEVKKCLQEKYKDNAHRKQEKHDMHLTNAQIDNISTEEKKKKKKITIEVDEDDPCLQQDGRGTKKTPLGPGDDPRFQQQNQTLRCWVMYTDFYRCQHILGAESSACTWFKEVFTSICPNDWIRRWDNLRDEGKFSWHKYKTQGEFPGNKYGE